jgi:hypothetical protein
METKNRILNFIFYFFQFRTHIYISIFKWFSSNVQTKYKICLIQFMCRECCFYNLYKWNNFFKFEVRLVGSSWNWKIASRVIFVICRPRFFRSLILTSILERARGWTRGKSCLGMWGGIWNFSVRYIKNRLRVELPNGTQN